MNIRRLLQHFLPRYFTPTLPLSDAHQEIERAEFFEHLAHETHLHENAYVVSSNDRNAIWYFLRAALRGDANASFKLGISYLHGDLGLDKNYQKAEKWLERAASQGHPEAKRYLSQAYSELAC